MVIFGNVPIDKVLLKLLVETGIILILIIFGVLKQLKIVKERQGNQLTSKSFFSIILKCITWTLERV